MRFRRSTTEAGARSARRRIRSATSSSGSKSIYFAGDTDLFDGMSELGPVDVGLIPIWGWGPGLGGGGHLDPARAAEAVARIEPGLVIPIHWGTYFPIHLGLKGSPASSICRRSSSSRRR